MVWLGINDVWTVVPEFVLVACLRIMGSGDTAVLPGSLCQVLSQWNVLSCHHVYNWWRLGEERGEPIAWAAKHAILGGEGTHVVHQPSYLLIEAAKVILSVLVNGTKAFNLTQ